ncbi:MAG: galactose mutarotase [Dorea sp.]|nr:galactose mutarotase [Dorea sp.]
MVCEFGSTAKGEKASLYTLRNKGGIEIGVTDYGAALVKVLIPDKDGKVQDVVLGYDSAKAYEEGGVHFGATVGRVANRIGGACFELNGKIYALTANDNGNSLHGGCDYYNKRMWRAEEVTGQKVIFYLESPDGDQGYPGAVRISVTYELTDDNEIKLHYHAVSDADTLINLTNHSYFNLSGHASGPVLGQEVFIAADVFTRADAESVPTGEIVPVEGTPMDFRKYKAIGEAIGADYEALILGQGYDHNWVLKGSGLRLVAGMRSDKTGIVMEVLTDLPGMQFYTGNFLVSEQGKKGAVYSRRHGACFETQYFPDAVHKEHFEGPVIKAGASYDTVTIYRFRTEA